MKRHEEDRAWLCVAASDTIQPKSWYSIIEILDIHEMSLMDFFTLSRLDRQQIAQTSNHFEEALNRLYGEGRLEKIEEDLEEEGIEIISSFDSRYPMRFKQYLGRDAPPVLFCWGDPRLLQRKTLGIVGTRDPSDPGARSARFYAEALARKDVNIVSGNARGIDTCAHFGALEGGGCTTLVLPFGILNWRASAEFRNRMDEGNSVVLSAWPPDASWRDYYAIARNNMIAALSDGLFAVETGLKGGTSYSVRAAARFGKPLWTLIYPPEETPDSAQGNHSLLSSGAEALQPLTSDEQIPEVGGILMRLKQSHQACKSDITWPPSEHPGQKDLIELINEDQ